MLRNTLLLVAGLALFACGDGNPHSDNADGDGGTTGGGDTGGDTDTGTEIDSDRTLPPGTASPSPNKSLFRSEPTDDDGSGMATGIAYDSATDTFAVDNLGFDGDNVYSRDDQVGSLNGFAVYENATFINDADTGEPIRQLTHKALYRVSTSGDVEVAVVRTGSYAGYGFGGFVYQRNGGVTLPTEGQATFSGDYAGLRDFIGRSGLEYVEGDMTVSIDFEDFNNGAAVIGSVYNRTVYDLAGNDITDNILAALETEHETTFTQLPTMQFVVDAGGVLDDNGELVGKLNSNVNTSDGVEEFESGNYYAVISGDSADEIIGVLVVTSEDPRADNVTTRETGAFLLTRP